MTKILAVVASIFIIAAVICGAYGLTIISIGMWLGALMIAFALIDLGVAEQKKKDSEKREAELYDSTKGRFTVFTPTFPEPQEVKEEQASEHFITADGYRCCIDTGKAIRYPLVSFTDFEYCPCCGKKLNWEDEENTK